MYGHEQLCAGVQGYLGLRTALYGYVALCTAMYGYTRLRGVVAYLTFTLMYGGIITHSFTTCKLHLKQSGKVPQPVL